MSTLSCLRPHSLEHRDVMEQSVSASMCVRVSNSSDNSAMAISSGVEGVSQRGFVGSKMESHQGN